jgi:hypothetical protein
VMTGPPLACLIHQAEIYVREVGIKSLDR